MGVPSLVPSVDWRLDGAARKQALLTSRIEGMRTTLTDRFDNEAGLKTGDTDDAAEVSHCLRAFRATEPSAVSHPYCRMKPRLRAWGGVGG